ncbi:MAG: beta-propeller fold lactonase family protein [Acidobacteriota bacterium]|nr:beta-propeller fold lactonase family protein [Acidobacteriota bacterium]
MAQPTWGIRTNPLPIRLSRQGPDHGSEARNFNLDPTGRWLIALNHQSNNVVTFAVDQQTGRLTATGQVLELRSPSCLRWVPLDAE